LLEVQAISEKLAKKP